MKEHLRRLLKMHGHYWMKKHHPKIKVKHFFFSHSHSTLGATSWTRSCLKYTDVFFFLIVAHGNKSEGKKESVNKAPNFVKPIASVPHRHSTRASTRSKRQVFEDKAPAATAPALHEKEELAGCSYQFGPLTQ